MTINRGFLRVSVTVGAISLAIVPGHAAEDNKARKTLDAVTSCRSIVGPAERLACYDKAAEALRVATASNEIVVVERQEVRKARKGLFGFALPRIGFLTGRPGDDEAKTDDQQLETTVTSARQIGYGRWRFTVEGGATWETTETSMNFLDPSPGAKVLLQKGALGGYYAKVGNGRRVQAKRVG